MAAIHAGSLKYSMAEWRTNPNTQLADSVEVVKNMQHDASSKIYIGVPPKEGKKITYSKQAINLIKRQPKNTFTNLTRLLDIKADDTEQLAIEQKFCTAEIKHDENGELKFEAQGKDWPIRDLLVMYIKWLKGQITYDTPQTYITHHQWLSDYGKDNLLRAYQEAEVKNPVLCPEIDATIAGYAG